MGHPIDFIDHKAIFEHFGGSKPEQLIRKAINQHLKRDVEKINAYYWGRRGLIPPHVIIDLANLGIQKKIDFDLSKFIKPGAYAKKGSSD